MLGAIESGFMWITQLGGAGILFTGLFILGLVFKLGFGKSFRAALTSATGFVGLFLVVDLLIDIMGPATENMVQRIGWDLGIVDVGWGLIGMAWGSPVAIFVIITAIVLNIVLLLIKFTDTLMIDFWNYWSFAAAGALAYGATESIPFSVGAAAVYIAICLKVADIVAPNYQEFYGQPGVSWPTGAVIPPIIIGYPVIKFIQKIPVIKDIKANPEFIQKKFGVLGEPVVMGGILGLFIGILAGFEAHQIIVTGIQMAAVLILVPRMIQVLMEGMLTVAEAASEFTQEHFKEREKLFIGIDASTILGHPATLASIIILTPLVPVLSVVLPGNQMLAVASVVAIPWFVIPLTSYAKGNIVHIVLASLVVFSFYLWGATYLAQAHTNLAQITGMGIPQGAELVSSLSEGGNPITALLVMIGSALGF